MIFIIENLYINGKKIKDLNIQINNFKNEIVNDFKYFSGSNGIEIDIITFIISDNIIFLDEKRNEKNQKE